MTSFMIQLGAGLVLLYAGGEGMVRGSACLGLRLGMTPLLTGLTLVAFGTSAPELVVSLQAALSGNGGLAIGNVVGSNICNIALILGLSTLIRPIEVESRLVRHDLPVMLVSALVLTLMLLDGVLSRFDSGILLLGLVAFILFTVRDSRTPRKRVREEFAHAVSGRRLPLWLTLTLMIGGMSLLVAGGRFFVDGAIGISAALGIDPAVIGLSVAAVGTSLPELATSVIAAFRGYGDMAAGNVIGSNIFNILMVLGLSGMVIPLDKGGVSFVDLSVMLIVCGVCLRLLATHAAMERWEGAALLAGFLGYMAWLFS